MKPMFATRRVALITCERFSDLYEDDLLLVPALAEMGVSAVPAVWSRPEVDWKSFDALIMRSPWDYFERPTAFRAWLDDRIASGVVIVNAPDILIWNFDKSYLQDLARKGVDVVPSVCIAPQEKADIAALARVRGWNEIVIKPTIGGGGYRTHRLRVDELPRYSGEIAEILADRGLIVQPFLPEIFDGELSLLFFDGVYSHAARKRPQAGEYRVQFQYGGTNESVEVGEDWVAQARVCVENAPSLPAYARVDGVVQNGRFLLMELEIFEPVMFLARHSDAPARFARAISARLTG
jgi:glutathione synthase/RimK-type ligase-like ATP-grasp enzyme